LNLDEDAVMLYLHIGAEKTGTTAIQRFLRLNRKKLVGQGFWLPSHLGAENHKKVAAYALGPASKDAAVRNQGLYDQPASFPDYAKKVEYQIAKLREISFTGNAIISSEDLHRMTADAIRRLRYLFRGFPDICIIFFVRRQDRLAISRFFQKAKGGSKSTRIFAEHLPSEDLYYNFHAYLDLWRQSFPEASIRICPYGEHTMNHGRDSIDLFTDMVGIDAANLRRPGRLNQSMDIVTAYLLAEINKGSHLIQSLERDELMRLLEKTADTSLQPALRLVKSFYEPFRVSNEKLAQTYFGNTPVFDDDLSEYEDGIDMRALKLLAKERMRMIRLIKGLTA
jgi:hypothetical protein